MPPVRALVLCLAVLVLGSFAMFGIPAALDLWDGGAEAAMLAVGLTTLTAVLIVARRTFGRPYLRKQVVVTALAAPVAVVVVLVGVLYGLELAGADCPRSGMDYISECNDLAGVSMLVFFGGIYVVGLLIVLAVALLLAAGIGRLRRPRPGADLASRA